MPQTYQWAKENAAIFTSAHSPSSWTLPGHVSMFTGLLPTEHGVELNISAIPDSLPFFTKNLRKQGYTTYAATSGGYLSPSYGWDKFFDKYYATEWDRQLQQFPDNGESFEVAKEYLKTAKEPYFLFLHTLVVHQYFVPYFKTFEENVNHSLRFNAEATDMEKREFYARAVLRCDRMLIDFIKSLPDDCTVIITSDHGEGLGDTYGSYVSYAHAQIPYPDQTYVPLIISGPDIEPRVSDELISTLSIPAFIEKGKVRARSEALAEYREWERIERLWTAEISNAGQKVTMKETPSYQPTNTVSLSPADKSALKALGYMN
jgi:arylsulfatase A-like enzyme